MKLEEFEVDRFVNRVLYWASEPQFIRSGANMVRRVPSDDHDGYNTTSFFPAHTLLSFTSLILDVQFLVLRAHSTSNFTVKTRSEHHATPALRLPDQGESCP